MGRGGLKKVCRDALKVGLKEVRREYVKKWEREDVEDEWLVEKVNTAKMLLIRIKAYLTKMQGFIKYYCHMSTICSRNWSLFLKIKK